MANAVTSGRIGHVLMMGGVTAGWPTAIHLKHSFSLCAKSSLIHVTESPKEAIIGVGEATVHSIYSFFAVMWRQAFLCTLHPTPARGWSR
ncbi:tryptophan 7-halogenase [Microbulbifer guangxiensis]|uniref:tryptophan 7-halogenase n=1 Tax=Microbulbifer guangxiensis TaxID=2904249 RepID=UPI001F1E18EE|nr:tryptophan 7-halogenase [Microbulbifer guangxiensis]